MLYLKVNNLSKSYTSKVLIDNLDMNILRGQKIALVAKNGAGKSTLLKLLMGEIDMGDGAIERKQGIRIGYLSQDIKLDENKTVREFLFDFDLVKDWEQEVELNVAVNKLGIKPYIDQSIKSLSGGEKKRVALAKVLMGDPEMLILDEPTNHLDLDMIERLERYLKNQHITLFMVTHDRYFLERICTDIFELYRGEIYKFPGNYSYYLEKKAIREENEKIEVHKFKQLYKKELNWIKRSPSGRQTKSNSRAKRFYDIQDNYDLRKDMFFDEQAKLALSIQERQLGGKILKLKHIKKAFGPKKILSDFSHEFRHNERIGIIGKNGVGKSTFVRMILGEESLDSGTIIAGETVVFGHYQQKEISFPDDKRVIDIVHDRKLLEQFLFPLSQQHIFANSLSGGEKRRLYLLTVLYKNPNFLILDEPTNDLDLVTINVLEEFLMNYKGCLIVVSHDRFFMDRITDHLFIFEGDGIVDDFWGTYSEYKSLPESEKKNRNKSSVSLHSTAPLQISQEQEQSQNIDGKKKLSYMEKRELDQLIKDIEKLEKERDEINRIFDHKDIPYDDIRVLSEELGVILRKLEQKEYRWFELSERQ
ncbi:ABC-F family ATP-binding cassette domain-containing protein [Candidatus Gracilibacteria bacterium]|nr:ABC-F family ATP-binding cassette domain-containing protein [Candidatus Gracilibacteria bacterium]